MNAKLKALKVAATKTFGRTGLLLRKHSPEILLATGVTGIVIGTVMACRATLKVEDVLDETKEKLDKIKRAKETVSHEKYSEQDYQKDLAITYVQTGVALAKLYGPSVAVSALGVASILSSHGIMKKRNLALMAAYKAVEESFTAYRNRVVAELGPQKDYAFKHGITQETETTTVTDPETGKKVKVKETKDILDIPGASEYARFFNKENSTEWEENPEYAKHFLLTTQRNFNDLLQARGHVFLNEVYDALGFKRTPAGAVVGWVKGQGDDFIDFHIFEGYERAYRNEMANDTIGEERQDFVNGYRNAVLLDFNIDGVIWDLI